MAFFGCASGSSGGGATITVTYSSDFYGETVTCSHGTKTYSKVATSSGTLEFSVDEEGTWTISCTIGSDTFTTTADVDLSYDAELVSLPDGETVLPTDDIETWLLCADIKDKSYTTLNEVLADSETYNALLGDSNACAYMKRSTTWSTDICASQYAMNLLGQYDTACDALLSDSTWASAIANSTYWESVLQPLVPVMTGDTTPSGEVLYNSQYSDWEGYKAFNPSITHGWLPLQNLQAGYIGYKFATTQKIYRMVAKLGFGTLSQAKGITIEGYDGAAWETLYTIGDPTTADLSIALSGNSDRYRMSFTQVPYSGSGVKIQFYGRASSSEKIHGGNPASNEQFYYMDSGQQQLVSNPANLDAGTYTIYSNLAKDPDNLSNDYGKTIRICPNTKEIVVRPDSVMYWWGYDAGKLEWCTTENGWSGFGSARGGKEDTKSTIYIPVSRKSDGYYYTVGTKEAVTGVVNQTKEVVIVQFVLGDKSNCNPCGGKTTKILSGGTTNPPYSTLQTENLEKNESVFDSVTSYLAPSGSSAREWSYNLYAIWLE